MRVVGLLVGGCLEGGLIFCGGGCFCIAGCYILRWRCRSCCRFSSGLISLIFDLLRLLVCKIYEGGWISGQVIIFE